jgi:large subunit ribosomal protein L10
LNRTSKEQVVADLSARLAEAKAAFLADFRGLNVEQATELRAKLREAGVDYRVVKNTLLKLASQGTDAECLTGELVGPTAIALALDDPAATAKVLTEFAKSNEKFELKSGALEGKLLSAAEIKALADLPSREEMLATMLSSMNAPLTNFVGTLAAVPRSMVTVLAAIRDQKS